MGSISVIALACAACGFVLLIGYLYYRLLLKGHLTTVNVALDKTGLVDEATGFWAKLDAKLLGWKTIILATIAGVFQGVPAFIDTYLPTVRDAPWAAVIDAKVASWISFVCVLLIPIVHARGMAKAATTQPADQG